jgi:hypothetical protein
MSTFNLFMSTGAGPAAACKMFDEQDNILPGSEQPAAAASGPLDWWHDPSRGARSLSDWTIEVSVEGPVSGGGGLAAESGGDGQTARRRDDEKSIRLYHCHKTSLAVGPRACGYFTQLFCGVGDGLAEHGSRVSQIELQASAAAAMPAFLDYVYNKGKLAASSANAAALVSLARYFQAAVAFKAAMTFVTADIKTANAAHYLAEAELYSLDKVWWPISALRASEAPLWCRIDRR